jgi:proteasome assembly chaperone (PAC2) family protein
MCFLSNGLGLGSAGEHGCLVPGLCVMSNTVGCRVDSSSTLAVLVVLLLKIRLSTISVNDFCHFKFRQDLMNQILSGGVRVRETILRDVNDRSEETR